MLQFKTVYNYLVNTLLAALMSFSLVHALAKSLNFIYNPYLLLLLIFVAINLFHVIFYNRLSFGISAATVAAGLITYAVYIHKSNLFPNVPVFIRTFATWFILYVNWEAPINKLFSYMVIAVLLISISIFIFVYSSKRFNFYVVLIAGVSIFVSQWIFNVFLSYSSFYVFLFVVPLYYLKHIYVTNAKINKGDYITSGSFVLWSIPFCAVAVALALSFPVSPKPLEWKWLDDKIYRINNYFNQKYNTFTSGDYFSLSFSGFGGTNSLGGKVRLDKTKVLKVEAPRQIYLKAIAKDLYTGSSWLNSDESNLPLNNYLNKSRSDLNEMLNRLNVIDRTAINQFDKYFYNDKVKVTFMDLRTKSLFLPSKSFKIELGTYTEKALVDSTGSLFCDDKLGKGFSYSFETYSPKYSDEKFINLLKDSNKGFYFERYSNLLSYWSLSFSTTLIEKNPDEKSYTINKDFLKQMDNFQLNNLASTFESLNEIYSRYLQLPDNLPPRVSELAASITKNAATDYDKVKAIEEYLSKNYPYTLTPEKTPKNRDFVDFFLFDGKQGYCSYFASSMAILARSAGIPARYVEGYVLPSKPVSGNTYEVTNEQAHAWVEVYFEGYGWLPFEPTSPFRSTFYSNQDYQGVYDPNMNTDPYYLQYMAMLRGYDEDYDLGDLDLSDIEEEKTWINYLVITLSIIALIIVFFLSIIVFNRIRVKIMLKKFRTASSRESILSAYSYYLKLIALNDLKIDPGETPAEFASRVDRFLLPRPVKFKSITEIFLKVRYSMNDASDKEKDLVLGFYENLISLTKSHTGKFSFFTLRYLLGRI